MTTKEKILYHQVHPAKLAADVLAGAAAVVLFAQGRFWPAFAVALLVPVAATLATMRYGDLEKLRRSRLGAYVKRYMTRSAQLQRLAGFVILCWGAWRGSFLLGVLGAALIVHAWTMGLLIPRALR